jgi:ABC-2 type transport system permease protein
VGRLGLCRRNRGARRCWRPLRPADKEVIAVGPHLGRGRLSVCIGLVGAAALIAVQVNHVASIPALGVGAILGDLLWFLLAFLLYVTAYAALAALVSRQEEVQGANAPTTILLLGSYLLVFVTLGKPNSTLSTIASLLPPFAPILMSVRMASAAAAHWQVGLAVALTLASIVGLTLLAGRVYANAATHIGARMRFRDALCGTSGPQPSSSRRT